MDRHPLCLPIHAEGDGASERRFHLRLLYRCRSGDMITRTPLRHLFETWDRMQLTPFWHLNRPVRGELVFRCAFGVLHDLTSPDLLSESPSAFVGAITRRVVLNGVAGRSQAGEIGRPIAGLSVSVSSGLKRQVSSLTKVC